MFRLLAPVPHDDDPAAEPVAAFIDVDEVPDELLDPAPRPDEEGDDRIHAPQVHIDALPRDEYAAVMAAKTRAENMQLDGEKETPFKPPARARVVPIRREIKLGMRGPDVVATKRAMSHAGYLRWLTRWDLGAGTRWRRAVKRFQQQHHLTADGVYGIATHRKLVALGHFDKYGARLMAEAPRPKPVRSTRQQQIDRIEAYLFWAYHNRDRIYYLQRRPMHIRDVFELPSWEDCSEFGTRAFKHGKAPDPNRRGYNGTGYTGTMAQNGRQGAPSPAALNLYGAGFPYKHVTVGVGRTRCMSMGSSPGPLLLSVRYRPDYSHTRVYF